MGAPAAAAPVAAVASGAVGSSLGVTSRSSALATESALVAAALAAADSALARAAVAAADSALAQAAALVAAAVAAARVVGGPGTPDAPVAAACGPGAVPVPRSGASAPGDFARPRGLRCCGGVVAAASRSVSGDRDHDLAEFLVVSAARGDHCHIPGGRPVECSGA